MADEAPPDAAEAPEAPAPAPDAPGEPLEAPLPAAPAPDAEAAHEEEQQEQDETNEAEDDSTAERISQLILRERQKRLAGYVYEAAVLKRELQTLRKVVAAKQRRTLTRSQRDEDRRLHSAHMEALRRFTDGWDHEESSLQAKHKAAEDQLADAQAIEAARALADFDAALEKAALTARALPSPTITRLSGERAAAHTVVESVVQRNGLASRPASGQLRGAPFDALVEMGTGLLREKEGMNSTGGSYSHSVGTWGEQTGRSAASAPAAAGRPATAPAGEGAGMAPGDEGTAPAGDAGAEGAAAPAEAPPAGDAPAAAAAALAAAVDVDEPIANDDSADGTHEDHEDHFVDVIAVLETRMHAEKVASLDDRINAERDRMRTAVEQRGRRARLRLAAAVSTRHKNAADALHFRHATARAALARARAGALDALMMAQGREEAHQKTRHSNDWARLETEIAAVLPPQPPPPPAPSTGRSLFGSLEAEPRAAAAPRHHGSGRRLSFDPALRSPTPDAAADGAAAGADGENSAAPAAPAVKRIVRVQSAAPRPRASATAASAGSRGSSRPPSPGAPRVPARPSTAPSPGSTRPITSGAGMHVPRIDMPLFHLVPASVAPPERFTTGLPVSQTVYRPGGPRIKSRI